MTNILQKKLEEFDEKFQCQTSWCWYYGLPDEEPSEDDDLCHFCEFAKSEIKAHITSTVKEVLEGENSYLEEMKRDDFTKANVEGVIGQRAIPENHAYNQAIQDVQDHLNKLIKSL